MSELKIIINDKTAKVFTPYNPDFVKKIRNVGKASWNRTEGCWIIPSSAVDSARNFMVEVYGESDLIKSPKMDIPMRRSRQSGETETVCPAAGNRKFLLMRRSRLSGVA